MKRRNIFLDSIWLSGLPEQLLMLMLHYVGCAERSIREIIFNWNCCEKWCKSNCRNAIQTLIASPLYKAPSANASSANAPLLILMVARHLQQSMHRNGFRFESMKKKRRRNQIRRKFLRKEICKCLSWALTAAALCLCLQNIHWDIPAATCWIRVSILDANASCHLKLFECL